MFVIETRFFECSEGTEKLRVFKVTQYCLKGSLTQRVGEIPIKFSAVHAKKLGEKRVPYYIICELVILCVSF
jgi:hypothetical protein